MADACQLKGPLDRTVRCVEQDADRIAQPAFRVPVLKCPVHEELIAGEQVLIGDIPMKAWTLETRTIRLKGLVI